MILNLACMNAAFTTVWALYQSSSWFCRVWMWTLWWLSTSRWTRPQRCAGVLTVRTDASTPTWAPPATSKWSSLRRSRSFPNQKRRFLRRKRYDQCFSEYKKKLTAVGCSDDHLGHLWINDERNPILSSRCALNVWRTGYHSNCCWWTLLNQFVFFFTDFSKETEKAETYVSGVNVNKVQHPYYQMTLFLYLWFYLLTWT